MKDTTLEPTNATTDPMSDVCFSKLNEFINGDKNVYLVLGGVGDLLLLLAVCYNNEKAHIVFLANDESSQFSQKFLDYFNLKYIFYKHVKGHEFIRNLYNKTITHPNFNLSAHLPDNFDWNDWINIDKYKNRLVTETNWLNLIGIKKRDKKYVIICPSASRKCEYRKRHLSIEEYNVIVKMYLEKDYEVITASSKKDFDIYKIYPDENCYWLTDSELINHKSVSQEIDFKTFLQTIISCDDIVSTDTWIKTFMSLCNKPCHVIKNRFNSKYKDDDSSNFIFLNTEIWQKLKIHTYEDFIEYIKCLP